MLISTDLITNVFKSIHINSKKRLSNIKYKQYNISIIDNMNQSNLNQSNIPKKNIETEKLGKQFEMAICLLYNIPYDGKYKYDMDEPNKIKDRLLPLLDIFPQCKHTAIGGGKYDFTAIDNDELRLSAKTNKKSDKVAPQYIGQAKPSAFCDRIGIPYSDNNTLKKYIQENITSILPYIEENTFNSPIIYYHLPTNSIRYISRNIPIDWNKYTYEWTRDYNNWTNSTVLKIKKDTITTSILEIQFHSTNRNNMAIRWSFNKLLNIFNDNFNIITF